MATDPRPDDIIASHYRVDPAYPPMMLSGALPCFGLIDRRNAGRLLLAVQTDRKKPPRPRMLPAARPFTIPYALMPLDQGVGPDLGAAKAGAPASGEAWFMICERPPGPSLAAARQTWSEQELIACVLLPAATALAEFQARGLTHRAIRPDNLFRGLPRERATLGPCWAAPPASAQPCVYEPVYAAWCMPNGRGDGMVADDVYALGVTLLTLITGRPPLAGLDDRAILRRKIEQGSFTAMTGGLTLPPLLSDLLRGMLAEEADHRPPPAILLSPERARSRRVAARPPRRAHAALEIDGAAIWSARELAFAIGQSPDSGAVILRNGTLDRWIRRDLGDSALAMRLHETALSPDANGRGGRQQTASLMRAITVLDPAAPLVWRGVAVMPDGIGPAVASAAGAEAASLEELLAEEATLQWSAVSPRRGDIAQLRHEAREWTTWLASRGPAGGMPRVAYGSNALLACASPHLGGAVVARLADLLPALDGRATRADRTLPPVDAHIIAYIASKGDLSLLGDLTSISNVTGASERLAVLRAFVLIQDRLCPRPFPEFCRWLVESGFADGHRWQSRKTRAIRKDAVLEAVKSGRIAAIVALIEDRPARQADEAGAGLALASIRRLETELGNIKAGSARREPASQRLGHEIVGFCGLIATLGAVLALAAS